MTSVRYNATRAVQQPVKLGVGGCDVFRVHEVEGVATDKLLGSIAQDADDGRTGVKEFRLTGDECDSVGAVLDEGSEAPLAGDQPLFAKSFFFAQLLPFQRPQHG